MGPLLVYGSTTGNHADATSYQNDGTQNGNDDTVSTIAEGQQFDGANDRITVGGQAELRITGDVSIEFWFNAKSWTNNDGFVHQSEPGDVDGSENTLYGVQQVTSGGNKLHYYHEYASGTNQSINWSKIFSTDQWYYIAVTRDVSTNNVLFYVDGFLEQTFNYTTDPANGSASTFNIGCNSSNPCATTAYDGKIDEVRISDVVRSTEWVELQDSSMKDNLFDFGSEQSVPPDTFAPDNDMTLNATAISFDSISLSWDPGKVDSVDAESVVIWYQTGSFPSINGAGATRLGHTFTDSADTAAGLLENTTYYFTMAVRDTVGNWSDSVTASATTPDLPWWDVNWDRRRQLFFDNSAQDAHLDSFAVLVKLFGSRIESYSYTQSNGEDIRFIDPGNVVLDYEIEKWDASGTTFVWVEIPRVDSASYGTDHFWMYYDNPSAADSQDSAATWNEDYAGVWHLQEDGNTDANGYAGMLRVIVMMERGRVLPGPIRPGELTGHRALMGRPAILTPVLEVA